MFRKTRLLKDLFWFLAFWGLVGGAFRLWFGLGATTHLTDAVPWGLWKILNMVAGVALSTSGFAIGFLVVVLKLEKLRPLLKPAILIAFLGYGCSCLTLLFDIGLPQRFWHPVFMWNEHSFLFEVFWCVLLYFTICTIELAPNLLERLPYPGLVKWLHRISFGVVVVGISLSSLHHSSLGSLFLVTPQRLHPLWYSPMLPYFFILSAMGGGLMVVVLIRILYARWYNPIPVFGTEVIACPVNRDSTEKPRGLNRPPSNGTEMGMLKTVAFIAVSLLALYLLLKITDLIQSGLWRELFTGSWESGLFLFEILIATVIPIGLILLARVRNTPFGLGLAALSAAAGLALNRMDVGIFGYFRDGGAVYFPSLAEWAVCLGVVAAAGLAFFFMVENFTIFDDGWKRRSIEPGMFKASYGTVLRMWNRVQVDSLRRVTLIAAFALPVAWVCMYPPFNQARAEGQEIQAAVGRDAMRTMLRIDGNRAGLFTDFPHKDHQGRMGEEDSCHQCHHLSMPNDLSTPCHRCHTNLVEPSSLFDHFLHMEQVAKRDRLTGWYPSNQTCAVCHTGKGPKSAANARSCMECHHEDMRPQVAQDAKIDLRWATSYQGAMHASCIPCHREQGLSSKGVQLDDCTTCHPTLLSNGRIEEE